MTSRRRSPDVEVCPGGPILLRGAHMVLDDTGQEHRTRRPVSAVCACGHTATKPWCDGTHKVATGRARRLEPVDPDDT
jgi:CDGSH-type Zn-finger protein